MIEYDIDKEESKKAEMKKIAGSTMIPVIDVEGFVIRGYAPDEIKRAVEQSRKAAP